VGGCTPKGENSVAVSEFISKNDLVGTGRAISVSFGINGVRKKRSHVIGPPLQHSRPVF